MKRDYTPEKDQTRRPVLAMIENTYLLPHTMAGLCGTNQPSRLQEF